MRLPSVLTGQTTMRQEHDRAERHLPAGREQHGEQKKQREDVPETKSQIFRKRVPHALDIVDDRGHQAPGRMVLEKTDGLPDDLCIDLIPQIGDARNPRVLHQHVAENIPRRPLPIKTVRMAMRKQRPDASECWEGRKEFR